jgi:hypothetical protein
MSWAISSMVVELVANGVLLYRWVADLLAVAGANNSNWMLSGSRKTSTDA